MRLSANSGLAWLGLGSAMALANAAAAQESQAICAACQAGKHNSAAHAAPGSPYMAPVAIERKPHGLVGHLFGGKKYVVPAYHQVAGQEPKPLYSGASTAPTGTPPSVVTAPPATALAESAPVSYDPYGNAANQGPAYGPDAIPTAAWGEPEPVGVMRTDCQTQMGPAAAAMSSAPNNAPGHASTAAPAGAQDQSIAMWHTVMQSGTSMLAGGDKRSLLSKLAAGDVDFDFGSHWSERRMARRMSRYYRSTGSVPYQPGAQSVPSMAVGAPH